MKYLGLPLGAKFKDKAHMESYCGKNGKVPGRMEDEVFKVEMTNCSHKRV